VQSDVTCWTVIRGAAAGAARDRDEFVRRYAGIVRAYLGARWRGSPLLAEIDDAVQDVFLDCLREGGALTRVDPTRPGGFRAFLFGVTRNIARRVERQRAKAIRPLHSSLDPAAEAPSPSEVFDRVWAKTMMRRAARLQEAQAQEAGPEARCRVDLLRLRFEEGMPIRDIAKRWQADAAYLHHEYAKARREFRAALENVIREHHPGLDGQADKECARLLACLR
jgi:RNA polymerase sigma-70 factor (ECF subfamily)